MKINKRLVTIVVFIIVIIVAIIIYVKTFAGKRYPDRIFEEDLVNVKTTEELNQYIADGTSNAEDIASTALTTLSSGTFSAADGIKGFFMRLFALRQIDEDYEQLKQRVIKLEFEQDYASELRNENARLQKLLGFVEEFPQYEYVPAKVLASNPNSWFIEFTINKGEKHGVIVNSAVVNADGLVGRVIEVYPNSSKVLTIIDVQSAVPVVAERSRDNGVAIGSTDPYTQQPIIQMNYLLNDADLVPGDQIISSALLDIFPKGIKIGEVYEVVRGTNIEKYAVITPSVDFSHIENILVVIGRSNQNIVDDSGIAEDIAEVEAAAEAESTEVTE